MPLYFAYGANLDIAAMERRCPRSRPIGTARLPHHRFFIMADGFASVRRERAATVHGLLWDLAPADVAALDDFEDIAGGLYTKTITPVLKDIGSAGAFLYVGHTVEEGVPRPGYIEAVVAAARSLALPEPYIGALAAWGRAGARGNAFDNHAPSDPVGPVKGVRPRFRTPHDR